MSSLSKFISLALLQTVWIGSLILWFPSIIKFFRTKDGNLNFGIGTVLTFSVTFSSWLWIILIY